MEVRVGEGLAGLFLEDMLDAVDHELDGGLGGIDDAVSIGDFDAEALEETFVNRVEERLFFVEIGDGAGGVFDGDVEVVEGFEKVVAGEGFGG